MTAGTGTFWENLQNLSIEDIMNKLVEYFEFVNVRYALVVGIFIAFCSALLGVTLVLKRFSFIGDGLSHVAFGATAVATAVKMTNEFWLVLPVTVICAVLLLRTGQNSKIKGDAATAMISVGTLAIGYLVMNLNPQSSNVAGDVCSTLFGSLSILTLTSAEVWLCVILSIAVIVIFFILYNKIFAVTFDENFATATGTNAKSYNLVVAVIIAVIVVLGMNMVGSLLISALVIFPALSAMRVFRSFKAVIFCSAVVSVISATVGMLIAILVGTPVGPTIVAVYILGFAMFSVIGFFVGLRR